MESIEINRTFRKPGNNGNKATMIEMHSVELFIDACCEGCHPDAKNRICYYIETERFYGNYRTYCQLNALPIADFQSVIIHVGKYFRVTDRIFGIMLRYLPLTRRRKNANTTNFHGFKFTGPKRSSWKNN